MLEALVLVLAWVWAALAQWPRQRQVHNLLGVFPHFPFLRTWVLLSLSKNQT